MPGAVAQSNHLLAFRVVGCLTQSQQPRSSGLHPSGCAAGAAATEDMPSAEGCCRQSRKVLLIFSWSSLASSEKPRATGCRCRPEQQTQPPRSTHLPLAPHQPLPAPARHPGTRKSSATDTSTAGSIRPALLRAHCRWIQQAQGRPPATLQKAIWISSASCSSRYGRITGRIDQCFCGRLSNIYSEQVRLFFNYDHVVRRLDDKQLITGCAQPISTIRPNASRTRRARKQASPATGLTRATLHGFDRLMNDMTIFGGKQFGGFHFARQYTAPAHAPARRYQQIRSTINATQRMRQMQQIVGGRGIGGRLPAPPARYADDSAAARPLW